MNPNIDLIHQKALSLISSDRFYEECVHQYHCGLCQIERLDMALQQFKEDCEQLLELCRDLLNHNLLFAVGTEIYLVELNYLVRTVKVKTVTNISGGLDDLIIRRSVHA